jgi:hypothetical protein
MGTNNRQQKPKYLSKPKDYTAFRKKSGGNFGLKLRQSKSEA